MTSLLGSSAISKVEVTELRFEPAPSQFVNENSTTQPKTPFKAKFLTVPSRDATLWWGGGVKGGCRKYKVSYQQNCTHYNVRDQANPLCIG